MDRYELAWAAGFFDGEGWAGLARHGRGDSLRPHARINQAGDTTPQALTRFRDAVGGVGAMGGPSHTVGRRPLYWWQVSSAGDVGIVYELLRPWLGSLKLQQLASAVRLATPATAAIDRGDEWRAWAAGLFDGEGCSALLRHRTHAGYLTPELSVTQSSRVGSPEVLMRFAAIVGAGAVSGPYAQRGATMPVFRWKAAARRDVERVIAELWPFLGETKRAQAQRLLDTLAAQPDLPRGNPAWGSHKTHCVHGHEYATARVRRYVPRGRGSPRRESQSCLVCLREYARRRRETRGSAADDDRRSISEPEQRYLLK